MNMPDGWKVNKSAPTVRHKPRVAARYKRGFLYLMQHHETGEYRVEGVNDSTDPWLPTPDAAFAYWEMTRVKPADQYIFGLQLVSLEQLGASLGLPANKTGNNK